MKIGIVILVAWMIAACAKATPVKSDVVPFGVVPPPVTGFEFRQSGWMTAPNFDPLVGYALRVDLDYAARNFTLRRTDQFASGEWVCPASTFGADEFAVLVQNLARLRPAESPGEIPQDIGDASLRIEYMRAAPIEWRLDGYGGRESRMPVLAGAEALGSQIGALARQIPCPAPVRRLVFARSRLFPAPNVPTVSSVSVYIDHVYKGFTFETRIEFDDRTPVQCRGTRGSDAYARLGTNIALVQEVPRNQPTIVDAGVAHLTLVAGRDVTFSVLENSDGYDDGLAVVDASALEVQLSELIRDCPVEVSQN